MVADIRATVDALRGELQRIDDSITFADLPPGLRHEPPSDIPPHLAELLKITDGPRCGSLVFFDMSSIPNNQFYTQDLEEGPERWICFGTCDYIPLFTDRRSEEVHWSPEEDGELTRLAADALAFFDAYALGAGYARITSADGDRWYDFLTGQGLLPAKESQ